VEEGEAGDPRLVVSIDKGKTTLEATGRLGS
jgi:hypothetical protein